MSAIFLLAFWLFLLTALAVAWQAGDRNDRRIILAIGGAALASGATHMLFSESAAHTLVVVIDLALLVVVVRYTLWSRRYWPLWFAAFHSTSVLFSFASTMLPGTQHIIAERLAGFWSIPAIIVMVIGLIADQHRGLIGSGR